MRSFILHTSGGEVFLSVDEGFNVQDKATDINDAILKINPLKTETLITNIIISQYKPHDIYLLTNSNITLYSPDCGHTLTAYEHEMTFADILPSK